MVSRTHNLIAFASLATAAVYYPPGKLTLATIIVALIANITGSLLPDLDQAGNHLWDMLPGGDSTGKLLKRIFLGHRTLSHSLLGLFLVYELTIWLSPKLFNAAFINPGIITLSLLIGYISHLLADGITEEGLPLLFPLKWKFGFPPIRAMRIKTDHWFEKIIIFPGVLIYLAWLLFTHWQILLKIF